MGATIYLLAHTDVAKILHNFVSVDKPISRPNALASCLNWLEGLVEEQLILPAYNYDFPQTRSYSQTDSSVHVGAIPEYARKLPGWHRTKAPVFSHTSRSDLNYAGEEAFGVGSIFEQLDLRRGKIALVGTSVRSMTYLHYIESLASSPYRYTKKFSGKVSTQHGWESIQTSWHVRPKGLDLDYDFPKIQDALVESGALDQPHPQILIGDANAIRRSLIRVLADDPLWLLNRDSRIRVSEKLSKLGRPFLLEDFE